jgi:putative transposase
MSHAHFWHRLRIAGALAAACGLCGAMAQGATDPLVSPHPQYLALHAEDTTRQRLYREWVQSAITSEDLDEIRRRLQCQHAFGTERFRHMIEEQLQRRAGPSKIGRPRKSAHQAHADVR